VELAGRGYDLALTARTAADLEETARIAKSDALIIPGDVADPAHAPRVVNDAAKRFGRIDALVNNAGYAPVRSIEQLSIDEWHRVIDVNLSATFYFCKAVWRPFSDAARGVIVNISSAASRDPFTGFSAYGAAKAGVNLFGLALAREGEARNIRVHTIAPAAVETGMFRSLLSKDQYSEEKTLPPAEVARIVALCVTGEIAATSGEVIHVHKRLA
jgi:NAD(P)-dependent dehydrogenase (short-subunit alcohol dehydrogenase family)